jgi:glycosyltransferase involved in cell wall biosynthesis
VSADVEAEYLQSSIYVMTSRFECLPLVLLESLSYGIPMVAFDCPTGPADIIKDKENGFLLPMEQVDAMASRISELISNEDLRKKMGDKAKLNSRHYAASNIYKLWSELFNRLMTVKD